MKGWHGWDDYAPSTTGRTRGRSTAGRRVLAAAGRTREARCSNWAAGRAAACPRAKRRRAWSASIDRRRCCAARGGAGPRGTRGRALRARGHPRLPFRRGRVRSGDGAVRHAAVADPSDLTATLAASRASARGGRLRRRPRPGSAALVRVPSGASRCRARGARTAPHASRDGAPGSRRRLTMFDQEYVERRGARAPVRADVPYAVGPANAPAARKGRLPRGRVLGDYQGGPWHPARDVWIILASRR